MFFFCCPDGNVRLLAVNADRQGREYVSAVEAFEYPIYGLQWHPEKVGLNSPLDLVLFGKACVWWLGSLCHCYCYS